MGTEHYFTARPASANERQSISVTLAGHTVKVETAGGVFSSSRLDLGTAVLLDKAPLPPLSGNFLDLGCGWGPIALTLALLAPAATVWAVDVNERALELTALNARNLGLSNIRTCLASEIPPDLRFDLIWSNPPIRIGKSELHTLLLHWLGKLADNGEAYLVVQRNLGADSLADWLRTQLPAPTWQITKAASAKGYRILDVVFSPHTANPNT